MKYVSPLTESQRARLQAVMDKSPSARARKRAHSILLSASGYTIEEIADIYTIAKRDTVSSWIDAWEERKFDGVYDRPRSGRPTALNALEQQRAIELLKQHPRQVKLVIRKLSEQFGNTVSPSTIKR